MDVVDGIFEGLEVMPVNSNNSIYYTYTTRIATGSMSFADRVASFVSLAIEKVRSALTFK